MEQIEILYCPKCVKSFRCIGYGILRWNAHLKSKLHKNSQVWIELSDEKQKALLIWSGGAYMLNPYKSLQTRIEFATKLLQNGE